MTISKELTPLDDAQLDELMNVPRGQYTIIRVSGAIEHSEGVKPMIGALTREIGAAAIDTVNLRRDSKSIVRATVMMCDDTGMVDGKPFNMIATQLYHRVCVPGTSNGVHGDVALVNDEDFGSE